LIDLDKDIVEDKTANGAGRQEGERQEFRSQEPGVRSQESGVRSQESGARSQEHPTTAERA